MALLHKSDAARTALWVSCRHDQTCAVMYQTTNWKACNAALKARGSLMICLDRDMQWHGAPSDKRGRTPTFSDAAIQFCLTIKCLFNLALRQATVMVQSFTQAGLCCSNQWRQLVVVPDILDVSSMIGRRPRDFRRTRSDIDRAWEFANGRFVEAKREISMVD